MLKTDGLLHSGETYTTDSTFMNADFPEAVSLASECKEKLILTDSLTVQ